MDIKSEPQLDSNYGNSIKHCSYSNTGDSNYGNSIKHYSYSNTGVNMNFILKSEDQNYKASFTSVTALQKRVKEKAKDKVSFVKLMSSNSKELLERNKCNWYDVVDLKEYLKKSGKQSNSFADVNNNSVNIYADRVNTEDENNNTYTGSKTCKINTVESFCGIANPDNSEVNNNAKTSEDNTRKEDSEICCNTISKLENFKVNAIEESSKVHIKTKKCAINANEANSKGSIKTENSAFNANEESTFNDVNIKAENSAITANAEVSDVEDNSVPRNVGSIGNSIGRVTDDNLPEGKTVYCTVCKWDVDSQCFDQHLKGWKHRRKYTEAVPAWGEVMTEMITTDVKTEPLYTATALIVPEASAKGQVKTEEYVSTAELGYVHKYMYTGEELLALQNVPASQNIPDSLEKEFVFDGIWDATKYNQFCNGSLQKQQLLLPPGAINPRKRPAEVMENTFESQNTWGKRRKLNENNDDSCSKRTTQEPPKVRPRLNLLPRTKPLRKSQFTKLKDQNTEGYISKMSSIFGNAKPVDTARRDREIEEKLLKEKIKLSQLKSSLSFQFGYCHGNEESRDRKYDLEDRENRNVPRLGVQQQSRSTYPGSGDSFGKNMSNGLSKGENVSDHILISGGQVITEKVSENRIQRAISPIVNTVPQMSPAQCVVPLSSNHVNPSGVSDCKIETLLVSPIQRVTSSNRIQPDTCPRFDTVGLKSNSRKDISSMNPEDKSQSNEYKSERNVANVYDNTTDEEVIIIDSEGEGANNVSKCTIIDVDAEDIVVVIDSDDDKIFPVSADEFRSKISDKKGSGKCTEPTVECTQEGMESDIRIVKVEHPSYLHREVNTVYCPVCNSYVDNATWPVHLKGQRHKEKHRNKLEIQPKQNISKKGKLQQKKNIFKMYIDKLKEQADVLKCKLQYRRKSESSCHYQHHQREQRREESKIPRAATAKNREKSCRKKSRVRCKSENTESPRSLELKKECVQVLSGEPDKTIQMLELHNDTPCTLVVKIRIPVEKYPWVYNSGNLFGPKGRIHTQLKEETGCEVHLNGRGSMKDKKKGEELRKLDGIYSHLNEDLHLRVESFGQTENAFGQLAYAVTLLKEFINTIDWSSWNLLYSHQY